MSESIINTPSLTIPVDSEHGALRLSVVGILWRMGYHLCDSQQPD